MADRKLSALTARTALATTDEVYAIAGGVPYRVPLSDFGISGSFTPTIYGSTTAGTQTYTVQIGRSNRIGKQITFTVYIALSAYDVTTAGELRISLGSLPASASSSLWACSIGYDAAITMPASSIMMGHIYQSSTYIRLYSKVVGGGAIATLNAATALSNSSIIVISGSYIAA